MPSKTDWWGRLMFQPPSLLESTRWYLALMGLSDQTSSQSTKPARQLPLWTSPCHLRTDMLPSWLQDKRSKRNVPLLAEHYNWHGYIVFLHAFIFSALGGWDPANESIINHLKLGHSYWWLMRKLMSLDAIQWSRDIYIEHLSGVRQHQEDTGGTRSG